jgi:hypothetical protein
MLKLRFYWWDDINANTLWDSGESTLVPKEGDNINLNHEKFIVTKTILDFDNDELIVFIQPEYLSKP